MFFGVGVDLSPSLERGVVTQETDNENARVVLIGASHMIRLAENMGPETVSLAFHGFRPREPTITELADELQKLGLGNRDTVALDLLSNSAFMGTDSYGLPTEAIRAKNGSYHVIGSLTVAPISCEKNILSACTPIAEALKNTDVVLLSPVPRYMHTKCCDDPTHVENFDDPDLEEEIGESLEGYKRVFQNWGVENELFFTVVDPTLLSDSCDLPIKSRVTEDGHSIWNRRDPVHLTGAAYRNLVAVISDTALSVDTTDSASASSSGAAQQRKRRAESVVTLPPVSSCKRLCGTAKLKVAGWLLGKVEPPTTGGRGPGSRWHGRGTGSGGGGHRGRGGWQLAFSGRRGWGGGGSGSEMSVV